MSQKLENSMKTTKLSLWWLRIIIMDKLRKLNKIQIQAKNNRNQRRIRKSRYRRSFHSTQIRCRISKNSRKRLNRLRREKKRVRRKMWILIEWRLKRSRNSPKKLNNFLRFQKSIRRVRIIHRRRLTPWCQPSQSKSREWLKLRRVHKENRATSQRKWRERKFKSRSSSCQSSRKGWK